MKKSLYLVISALLAMTLFVGCATSNASNNQAISVVSREDGSGTRGAFIELFGIEVKGDDGSKKDTTTKDAVIANKTDVMLTNVANDPNAIGYISLGSLNDSVKALQIDGVVASAANVKNGTYPVARPFNIATKGDLDELTADFINFIMSKEGQDVVAASYIAIDENAPAFTSTKPAGKITVAGSSSVTPIMEKLKEAYLVINPDAAIEIQMTDSSAGLTSAMEGVAQIGMASRELKDNELAELNATAIAMDGIAVIVNNENTLTGATSEQIKAIFTGETTSWGDIK